MNNFPNITDILIQTFNGLIKSFSNFISGFIGFITILLVGWAIARIVAIVVKNTLSRIGFDKIGDRLNRIEPIKNLGFEIKLSTIISKVLYYFILIAILRPAADTLGVPAISDMVKLLVEFIPKLISAGIMLFAGAWLADTLRNFVVTLCASFKIAAGKLIGMAVFFFLLIIFVIQSVAQVGINTSLLESSFNLLVGGIIFAFAIGYGFASKEILINILASFYSRNKFKEGQEIEVDGVRGVIISIDNTNMTLQTGETKTIFPLQVLQSKKVIVYD